MILPERVDETALARAAYGSTPCKVLLRLPEEMDRAIRQAAKRERMTVAEYVR